MTGYDVASIILLAASVVWLTADLAYHRGRRHGIEHMAEMYHAEHVALHTQATYAMQTVYLIGGIEAVDKTCRAIEKHGQIRDLETAYRAPSAKEQP